LQTLASFAKVEGLTRANNPIIIFSCIPQIFKQYHRD
jgi:hypothetical protein